MSNPVHPERSRARAPRGKRFSDEMITEALRQSLGDDGGAAELLGCSKKTVYRWRKDHPDFAIDFVSELGKRAEQLAHAGLLHHLEQRNLTAVKFYLTHKGGWSAARDMADFGGSPPWADFANSLPQPMEPRAWEEQMAEKRRRGEPPFGEGR